MNNTKIRTIATLLCLCLLLSGCTLTERLESAQDTTSSAQTASGDRQNTYFGMAYNTGENVNPITSTSGINRLLIDALYEGLFVLDATFTPENMLCESYSGDGTTFTFHLKSGVTFWSGQPLRASDVVYTYTLAQKTATSPYYDRMQQVSSMQAVDANTVRMTLKEPNTQFAKLLDIPVFREGTENDAFSDGTGPYQPQSDASVHWLTAYQNWHQGAVTAYPTIHLVTTTRSDAIVYSFETGDVSLTRADRISATPATIRGAVEIYQMPTTKLQYLGVNFSRAPYQVAAVRQAISTVLDRASICTTQLQSFADPAVLPVNPQPAANDSLSYQMKGDTEAALRLLETVGVLDSDGDGVLDYTDAAGKRVPFAPVILVNNENTFKVAGAQQVATYLETIGVPATVQAVSFAEYQQAIVAGQYDLYYAETQMTADFDLRPLIGTGGALNYSAYSNGLTDAALQQLRTASGSTLEGLQQTLYEQLLSTMPIIPVAFLRGQIALRSGLIPNYTCAPDTAFYQIQNWRQP